MVAAVEDEDPVLRVRRDAGDLDEAPAIWQRPPARTDLEARPIHCECRGFHARPPATGFSSGPRNVVPGRVQPDSVEALVHGDVEDVLVGADAEIDVARIADRLASTLL